MGKQCKVKRIVGYSILRNQIDVEIAGAHRIYSIPVKELKMGGKNCEIDAIQDGSTITCGDICHRTRTISDVRVLSCGCRECDEQGNMVKW